MGEPNDTVLLTPKLSLSAACFQCGTPLLARRCGRCGTAAVAGGWRTLRVLSDKSWSRVYQAQDDAGKQVALKELLFSEVPGATKVEAFTQEADVLAKISHPSVPRLLESFQEGTGVGTRLYLAYEFVPGRSLASLMETRSFSEEDVSNIAQQVLSTLSYLHGRTPRIIHRDIKPVNLIMRADGGVALVDFGTARGIVDVTFSSTFGGTFGYAPVEQLGGTVDVTTDLYALGATLVHVLTGNAPENMLGKDCTLNIEGLDVSPRFRRFLGRLLARSPQDRFPSAEAALMGLLHREPEGALVARSALPRRMLLAAGIAAGALAMLLAGHYLWAP